MSQPIRREDGALNVVFGTGPLGLAVARRLVGAQQRVRMVNRSGRGAVPDGSELIAADVTDPQAARRAGRGATTVFHCACGPYGRWPETLPRIMDGIIAAASEAAARIVYGDNLYAYGPVTGLLTEDLPYRPVGPSTTTRARLATTLMDAHAKGIVAATIGRASDFFGPHVRLSIVGNAMFPRALAAKPAQALGDPDTPHTYTFIDDFAAGLVTLGARDEAPGQVWHVPSADTVTTRQFVEMVYGQAANVPRLRVAPGWAFKVLGLFIPAVRAANEVLYQSAKPWVVDHGKFERAFGAEPTPHRDAIATTLEWFREHAAGASGPASRGQRDS